MTTKSESKGQRIVRVTPEFFQDIFVSGACFETDLPDDSRLLSIQFSENSRWQIWMKFESSEWEPLNEGKKIPFLDVQLETKPEKDREYFLKDILKESRLKYE